ncbi:fasciclin domain-containing protein [Croceicoccus marinus]|uniref:Fasciclin domain-containing protein n=1 Tax=Croceicoccus marinus TaxID=450378 RepID=A0A7G6VWC0_9SPHN|nr:fasciclin domain-containing protein [Croceicoccus marinus]QNE06035.1 fasciclin domain-containing protein [Croceicoccus marinus]
MRNRTVLKGVLLLALAGSMAACSDEPQAETPQDEVGNETLAAAMAGSDDVSSMSKALQETGLAQVFDGSAAYTVLAPSNDALAALEEEQALNDEEHRALLAAVLREHVLPGALTPEDIENAIEVQNGAVSIQTMGDGTMRFAMDGEQLTVTDQNGRSANISGDAILASNGVVIPIDGVLKTP